MNTQSRISVITLMAATALLAAACGSSPSSTGSGASPSTGGSASSPSTLALAHCIRSHGVPNFPDPDSSGNIPNETPQQLGVSGSRLQAAANACQSVDPKAQSAANQPLTAQERQDYLRATACMRSHGITDFPDPTFPGGHVTLSIPASIDISSPQVTRAKLICEKLIPAGLPYSGTN